MEFWETNFSLMGRYLDILTNWATNYWYISLPIMLLFFWLFIRYVPIYTVIENEV
jgi:hypothetical protein